MINLQITLPVFGVTKIPIDADEVILHIYYDANDTFYHNHHTIFLEYTNDITFCQIWFHKINQSQSENELLLEGAIKTLNIVENTTKAMITLAIDKRFTDETKFFAEVISGDTILADDGGQSFVTTDVFDATVNQIYNDLSLTAERIVQNSINPDTSNSSIELTNDRSSFYVQTNAIDLFVNQVYADWDLELQPLTLIDNVGTLTTPQINSLSIDYPRPEYILKPNTNLMLERLSFYVIRNFEGWYLNTTEFQLSAYHDRFGFILDSTILTDKFVKIQINNLTIIAGSPNANLSTFPSQGALTTTPRQTIKYPYCTFKIWKDTITRSNIIFTIPLTDTKVTSTKTTNTLLNSVFWINNEGWYFGSEKDGKQLFAPITTTYDIYAPSPTIDLVNAMQDTITCFSFANMDPSRSSLPAFSGSLVLNPSNIIGEVTFTLRLILAGVVGGTQFRVRQNLTTILSYNTTNISSQPNIIDYVVKANSTLIEIFPIIKLENENYYDWGFIPNIFALSVAKLFKQPATRLTAQQYSAFNPDQPISINIVANSLDHIILRNLSFFTLRNSFIVRNSSNITEYITTQYQDRLTININTDALSTTDWVLIVLDNIFYQQGRPVANSSLFPASTSNSTDYNRIEPTGRFDGRFNIGNISNAFFRFPVSESIPNGITLNAKFWIKKQGVDTLLYQGLESEASDILYIENATNSIYSISVPLDNSLEDKILYPRGTAISQYNWVNYNQIFRIEIPYVPIAPTIPKYQFFIRLYCVYGANNQNTTFESGMQYNANNNTFQVAIQTNNAPRFQFRFLRNASSFLSPFAVILPSFPTNDPKVVDLIFEVDPFYFSADNFPDIERRITYLGQRIVKL